MSEKPDPITGVVPREEWDAIKALPHGEAARAIRRYDPDWPSPMGDLQSYEVKVEATVELTTHIIVKARNVQEAQRLAEAEARSYVANAPRVPAPLAPQIV